MSYLSLPCIGAESAELIVYLPNPPVCYDHFDPQVVDVPRLIESNGNHWRKIFTIMAKLSCNGDDWRGYRDRRLLGSKEQICFESHIQPGPAVHLVAGKASWQRLGLSPEGFRSVDAQGRAWQKGRVLLTPYLDYRQFPNDLVALCKGLIHGGGTAE